MTDWLNNHCVAWLIGKMCLIDDHSMVLYMIAATVIPDLLIGKNWEAFTR